ncbi:MAG: YbgC/FadM family acyl-CoA thioesterase [Burkholderiales bacterium]|jgi:YbgC/YbaW family acyl-CoA thioester hydrolase|nr:YbgC/FadM family acyl-CoA thioesterase [Burkholderiales bacterium]
MKRADFRLAERIRVRWAEIDAQKIVFNGHYLTYIDTAVGAYWRALALPYEQTVVYLGGDMYMRKSTLEYQGSARYDDVLEIGIRCTRVGTSSMIMSAGVFRQDELLVSGELVYVFADPATQTSKPVPQELRDVLQAFEAGKPRVDVRVGTWNELGGDARAIRTSVFVDEQKIPADMEWDEADASCIHAVAVNRFGVPLATGRLLEHVPGVAKIGRMAVVKSMRGSRVGRSVLDSVMLAARAQGQHEVVLHAQTSAAPFYARAGFSERGPVFEEAGIAHVEMVRAL